jgi:hypothetical protein
MPSIERGTNGAAGVFAMLSFRGKRNDKSKNIFFIYIATKSRKKGQDVFLM